MYFQHYCIRQKHTLSIVAILENSPKCISDIYDKSCGSHGKITFQMSSIEATLTASQLRWTGHIIRMNDSRLPKAVFYGELAKGKRLRGGQRLRYKDVVKRHLKATHIPVDHWETLAQDRQQWRQAFTKEKAISKKRYHINTNMITISAMAFLMLLPLSSSVSTTGEALNHKLDYSLTNEQSTSRTNPYTDVIIRHDGQQRE